MLRSMTGFGAATREVAGLSLRVEAGLRESDGTERVGFVYEVEPLTRRIVSAK